MLTIVGLTDNRAIDDGRELLSTVSEVVADRRKGQDNVQVLSDKLNEVLPAVFAIGNEPFSLDLVGHVVHLTEKIIAVSVQNVCLWCTSRV